MSLLLNIWEGKSYRLTNNESRPVSVGIESIKLFELNPLYKLNQLKHSLFLITYRYFNLFKLPIHDGIGPVS